MKILETHIVPALDEKIRLQEYAASAFKSISTRSGIKKAIKRKEILIDGTIGNTSDWVQEHQKLELLQQEVPVKKVFQLGMEVVFEDDFLAVVKKPPGYPTSGNYFKTIENALPFNLKVSREQDALSYPLPVHRLDNPTGGLLLIAKTRTAQTILNLAFEHTEIHKTYLAVVHGEAPESCIFDSHMDGKTAITKITRIGNFSFKDKLYSMLEVSPETGRTHQIRIHLSGNDLPIVGDMEYGLKIHPFHKKGLYLAAVALDFTHPISQESMSVKIDPPQKFRILEDL
ncbi:RluA family pseudouridine synthase [Gillisia limnaea]|uniref:Pseudouridine synthase n=1 Tax=Gillisia limnaea (strain DSM 15749 / LMG 21470 / R-8282) TaxID=865937 RepID=H2BX75_GILLR|nr:RluA family pseudouridine synthase [Gillisia limnaea]EHQ03065.1 pseudouridine synthase [Gillisia limnaea DSM 15749]